MRGLVGNVLLNVNDWVFLYLYVMIFFEKYENIKLKLFFFGILELLSL